MTAPAADHPRAKRRPRVAVYATSRFPRGFFPPESLAMFADQSVLRPVVLEPASDASTASKSATATRPAATVSTLASAKPANTLPPERVLRPPLSSRQTGSWSQNTRLSLVHRHSHSHRRLVLPNSTMRNPPATSNGTSLMFHGTSTSTASYSFRRPPISLRLPSPPPPPPPGSPRSDTALPRSRLSCRMSLPPPHRPRLPRSTRSSRPFRRLPCPAALLIGTKRLIRLRVPRLLHPGPRSMESPSSPCGTSYRICAWRARASPRPRAGCHR